MARFAFANALSPPMRRQFSTCSYVIVYARRAPAVFLRVQSAPRVAADQFAKEIGRILSTLYRAATRAK